MRAKYNFRTQIFINIQVNIGLRYFFEPCFPVKVCKTYQDMFNQNIFKQESSEIANTYILPSKNQAIFSMFFFIPSKNEARQKWLRRVNQDWDQSFDTEKLEIKNFKQVLLFSGGE